MDFQAWGGSLPLLIPLSPVAGHGLQKRSSFCSRSSLDWRDQWFPRDFDIFCWRNEAQAIELRLTPNCSVWWGEKCAGVLTETENDWEENWNYPIANTLFRRRTSQLLLAFQHQAVLSCFSCTTQSTWRCIREQRVAFLRPHKLINDPNFKFLNDLSIWSWPLTFPVSRRQGW